MSKQLNPFTSNTEREAAYTQATAMELSELIGLFPGVANARVIINAKSVTRIEGSIPPSATVIVNTKGEFEHTKQLVRACADGVAHAVSGLIPSQISVIVNGVSIKVPDADSAGGISGDLQDIRKAREAELEQKIRTTLLIDGLTVSVNCDVENRSMEETGQEYKKEKSFTMPLKDSNTSEDTSSGNPASREPGASPNTGSPAGTNGVVSLEQTPGGTGSPGNTTHKETDDLTNAPFASGTTTKTIIPAGKDSVQSATVRVPLSYFNAIYKQKFHKTADANDADFVSFNTAELSKIHDDVKHVVNLKDDSQLAVDTYVDITPDLAMSVGPTASSVATLNTVGGHAREIAVAVLAVVSLLMMATLVRKSAPMPAVLNAVGGAVAGGGVGGGGGSRGESIGTLGSGESVAGEVSAGVSALDGIEMDEEAVRTQQMLDQVSVMVKENPDGAAALVKRWLSRA
jgi:flagellar biosynthesis/type III secretory pathway M-ring protein FliF/YscJ